MQFYNVNDVTAWAEGRSSEIAQVEVGDKVRYQSNDWEVIAVFHEENKVKFKKI